MVRLLLVVTCCLWVIVIGCGVVGMVVMGDEL